ncbi:hypothetical protein T484DRAFT_1836278, partial [Baffinella frigidus]
MLNLLPLKVAGMLELFLAKYLQGAAADMNASPLPRGCWTSFSQSTSRAAGMLERLLGKYLQGAAADMNAFPLQKQLGDVKETLREVTRRVTPLKQEYEEMVSVESRPTMVTPLKQEYEEMVSVVEAAKKAYDEAYELDQEIDHYKGELDDLGHVSDVTHDLISVATQLAEVNTKLRECEDIKAKGSKEVEAKKRAWLDGADGKIGLRQL